jgi:hypothetical protein
MKTMIHTKGNFSKALVMGKEFINRIILNMKENFLITIFKEKAT